MIFAQRLLPDVESALVERFGLPVLPLVVVEYCQVVKAIGGVRMIFAQRFLPDGQRAPIERLCLNVLASVQVNAGQAIDGGSDIAVFIPQESFTALQREFS